MRCVHGEYGRCPDCEYEADCRARGVKPENRWENAPLNPWNHEKWCGCIGCQRKRDAALDSGGKA